MEWYGKNATYLSNLVQAFTDVQWKIYVNQKNFINFWNATWNEAVTENLKTAIQTKHIRSITPPDKFPPFIQEPLWYDKQGCDISSPCGHALIMVEIGQCSLLFWGRCLVLVPCLFLCLLGCLKIQNSACLKILVDFIKYITYLMLKNWICTAFSLHVLCVQLAVGLWLNENLKPLPLLTLYYHTQEFK